MSATLALLLAAVATSPGHDFAVSLADRGDRPAASARERDAQVRVQRAFRAAGLRLGSDRFTVPGRGRSRNVVGAHR